MAVLAIIVFNTVIVLLLFEYVIIISTCSD